VAHESPNVAWHDAADAQVGPLGQTILHGRAGFVGFSQGRRRCRPDDRTPQERSRLSYLLALSQGVPVVCPYEMRNRDARMAPKIGRITGIKLQSELTRFDRFLWPSERSEAGSHLAQDQ